MSKDSSSVSPSPKKLLAGLEDMLDDEMNSVDRMGVGVSGKSTKMRTTSQREVTTKPACPDKESTEIRNNSINVTTLDKSGSSSNNNNEAAPSNLSVRIVDRGRYAMNSKATAERNDDFEVIPASVKSKTIEEVISTSVRPTTTTTTTTTTGIPVIEVTPRLQKIEKNELVVEPLSSTTMETPRYTVPSRNKVSLNQF
ncbi:hypothetical protein QAD02_016435 [Eretmocerus hayati]|uniref:Uncharacterized protein n=1 Tax=Eretmocerus hayati TaxID=131215 RepID=A0ACC2PB26_9HYME|nr:hypothetical protein QAD02_016435 [Eretmocerus hayati]